MDNTLGPDNHSAFAVSTPLDLSLAVYPSPVSSNTSSIAETVSTVETTSSSVSSIPEETIVASQFIDVDNLRCHYLPKCEEIKFKGRKELKRHAKGHDPGALKYCGCCRNLGDEYRPVPRKDKLQDHLRSRHDMTTSEDKKSYGIRCPSKSCCTLLFTALSCVESHSKREHPEVPLDSLNCSSTEATCECSSKVQSRAAQLSQQIVSRKHRATSPMESVAKREKNELPLIRQHPFECQAAGIYSSTTSITDDGSGGTACEGFLPFPDIDLQGFGNGFCDFEMLLPNMQHDSNQNLSDHSYSESGPMYPGFNDPFSLRNLDFTAPLLLDGLHRESLSNSSSDELYDLLENKDFYDWWSQLESENENYVGACIPSILYSHKQQAFIVEGYSRQAVKDTKEKLRKFILDLTRRQDETRLLTSDTNQAGLACPNFQTDAARQIAAVDEPDSGQAKIWPVKPKDHRRVVIAWLNIILPSLPKVLNDKLEGDYSASLVLRGATPRKSRTCIMIESPCVPGPEAQRVIQDQLSELYAPESDRDRINVCFLKGRVSCLNGSECDEANISEDTAEDCHWKQQLQFNLSWPCPELTMGASLGMLCSENINATLGGFIMVDDVKCIQTSEHFIARSQESSKDKSLTDSTKFQKLTSPSRYDLSWLKASLDQTKLDNQSQNDHRLARTYGESFVPLDRLYNPAIRENRQQKARIEALIREVDKPLSDFVIGQTTYRSTGPRVTTLPVSLADYVEDARLTFNYHMDWAVCDLESQMSRTGQNHHRYQSNEDAAMDNCIEKTDHVKRNGGICYQTCAAEVGITVHFLGQGSKHRKGKTGLPIYVRRNSTSTLDFTIIGEDGKMIPSQQVAGDSGAWVLRQGDNAVMGQIHSHSQGQILFTPIETIFEDIKDNTTPFVSLPAYPRDVQPLAEPTSVISLCAVRDKPTGEPLSFLGSQIAQKAMYPAKTKRRIPPPKDVILNATNKVAADMPEISVIPPGNDGLPFLRRTSLPTVSDEVTRIAISALKYEDQATSPNADSLANKPPFKNVFRFQIRAGQKMPTWPADRTDLRKELQPRSKVTSRLRRLALNTKFSMKTSSAPSTPSEADKCGLGNTKLLEKGSRAFPNMAKSLLALESTLNRGIYMGSAR